jgi:isochorismate hydrolase
MRGVDSRADEAEMEPVTGQTPSEGASDAASLLDAFPQRQRGTLPFIPERSALLVLDMQQYFLDPKSHAFVPNSATILPDILQLMSDFARIGRPVIATCHIDDPDRPGMMQRWWKGSVEPESEGSRVLPDIEELADSVLTKCHYDAFHETDLDRRLREQDVTQIVITGLMTHLCCESTARAAFVRGFEVQVPIDGTTAKEHANHIASLLNLSNGFAVVTRIENLLARLNTYPTPGHE